MAQKRPWRWQGIRLPSGKPVAGYISAESEDAARQSLAANRDMVVLSVGRAAVHRRILAAGSESKLGADQLAELLYQIAAGIASGQSQQNYLHSLAKQLSPRSALRDVVEDLRQRISEGGSLADAFEANEHRLAPEVTAVMRVSDELPDPDRPIRELAELTETSHKLRSTLVGLMRSFALQMLMAGGVAGLIVFYLVPRLLPLFDRLDSGLPLVTRMMVLVSDVMIGSWQNVAFIVAIAVCGIVLARSSPEVRVKLSRFVLRVPIMGKYISRVTSQRLAALVACLLEAGITARPTIALVADAVPNKYCQQQLKRVESDIALGVDMSDAIAEHYGQIDEQIAALALQAEVGVDNPGEAWRRYASAQTAELDRESEKLKNGVKGVSTLIIGVVLAISMMSVLLPMSSLMSGLSEMTRQ